MEKLDDERTPAYSIAPLSNQLRLIEAEMERLTAHANVDDGLPDPELFGLVDALAYASWLRGPQVPARRKSTGLYAVKQAEIFESWKQAGFELSPRAADSDGWVEENRVRLLAAVEDPRRKENQGEAPSSCSHDLTAEGHGGESIKA